MKLLWTVDDFNIDNGYIINYVSNNQVYNSHSIHTARVIDGKLLFLYTLGHQEDYKVYSADGGADYDIMNYATHYAQDPDDIHFLLTEEEFIKHIVMEEI